MQLGHFHLSLIYLPDGNQTEWTIDNAIPVPSDANRTGTEHNPTIRLPNQNWTLHSDFEPENPSSSEPPRNGDVFLKRMGLNFSRTPQNASADDEEYYAEWYAEKELKINDTMKIVPKHGGRFARSYLPQGGSDRNRNSSDGKLV